MSKESDVDDIANLLIKTQLDSDTECGVSFANRGLKLDTKIDANEVINAIIGCKKLTYLNLEGNTLGIDAAEGISKALELHPEFKRALWKDLFTGRLKEEIPDALRFLGVGLMLAEARLSELDLSDNAFGPIGVEGLASLLRSPCCYALQELKLNNNGLGITGGKLLAKALMSCYNESKAQNQPLALKVFIAGRNRLENEGAKALSEVFMTLKTLEEIRMPQNGIYHVGIKALAKSFQYNKNLKVIDLNDNTLSINGCAAIAKVLPRNQLLSCLNLGDCLLKTKGAISIADALTEGHTNLEEVNLACNEISKSGGLAIVKALSNKTHLKKLILDGNQFGKEGLEEIRNIMASNNCDTVLNISDDEGTEEEEESGDDDVASDVDNSEEGQGEESSDETNKTRNKDSINESKNNINISGTGDFTNNKVNEFLNNPLPQNFLSLGDNKATVLIEEIKKHVEDNEFMESLITSLMKVSSITTSNVPDVKQEALACADCLYQELFSWASKNDKLSLVNNALLVHHGLLKSEDKKFKIPYNVEGCQNALQHAMKQKYFPDQSRDTMNVFFEKQKSKNIETIVL